MFLYYMEYIACSFFFFQSRNMGVFKDTPKSHYASKESRRRGLQKTRFYCSTCERQCLDQHGYDLHCKSETHIIRFRRAVQENGGSLNKLVNNKSNEFHKEMISTLRRHHGFKSVRLNNLYQEHIAVKGHVHLNATRWPSLTAYSRFLAQSGDARVWNENDGDDDDDDEYDEDTFSPSGITVAYMKKEINDNNDSNNNSKEVEYKDETIEKVIINSETRTTDIDIPVTSTVTLPVEDIKVPQKPLEARHTLKFALKKKKT